MECSPDQIRDLIDIIKPYGITGAAFVVLYLFRDTVSHFFKAIIDLIFKRK